MSDSTTVNFANETAVGGAREIRTKTIEPIDHLKIIEVKLSNLNHINHSRELVETVFDAIQGTFHRFVICDFDIEPLLCSCIHIAHKAYYDAGVLHGDVTYRNIMILQNADGAREGVLLDLEHCVTYQSPYVPGIKPSTDA